MSENLAQEFCRLIQEYGSAEGSVKQEAWNLIADFAIENSMKISLALDKAYPSPPRERGR